MRIQDGTGAGFEVKIDSTNRMLTQTVTETEQLEASVLGNSYQIGSGAITLTSATESAVLFIRNDEDDDLIITAVNVTSTKQTGSTAGVFLSKVYLEGTDLSAGVNQVPLNSNFGSNKSLACLATAGQEAATVTDGVVSGAFFIQEAMFFNTELAWVLPKGKSVAVSITPGVANTSLTLTVTLEAHIARKSL